MAGQNYTVPIADPELARRPTEPSGDTDKKEMSNEEQVEHDRIEAIVAKRKRYEQDRKGKEKEWVESFKMYMSWVDKVLNPFLSQLFIPKTHEAVELLSAFLIGTNQSISATAENGAADLKARVAGRWLEYLWRKVLKARLKILVMIKQGIIFGNGYMKVGFGDGKPWMNVPAIEDLYYDYFAADIQESDLVIHEIRRDLDDVKNDEKYDLTDKDGVLIRTLAITGGTEFANPSSALFNTFDGSFSRSENRGKVLVMEVWGKDGGSESHKLLTLLPTSIGWRIARDADNPNRWRDRDGKEGDYFVPIVKFRFKTAALPNRGYDMGGVWPTVHIQKAFNDLIRQYFDGVVILNNPMGKKRRGARINPMELVRRPGGIITMGDITKDFAWDSPPDMKASIVEMLNRLDKEFQEASMVVNLVKGISESDTATGDALAQQNVQTLLDMINQNLEDALSELGQMVLAISLANQQGEQELVLYENDKETAVLNFDLKNIDGQHDIRIVPDRSDSTTKASQNAGLLNFLKIIGADATTLAQYPSLKPKLYKRYLENSGVGDPDYFFTEEGPAQPPPDQGQGEKPPAIAINYKDAPPDVQREIEAAAGLQPSKQGAPAAPPQQTTPQLPSPKVDSAPLPTLPRSLVRKA